MWLIFFESGGNLLLKLSVFYLLHCGMLVNLLSFDCIVKHSVALIYDLATALIK